MNTTFAVQVSPTPVYFDGGVTYEGRITIGDFSETLNMGASYWGPSEYERQWKTALMQIVDGCSAVALVTFMVDPSLDQIGLWRPMYRFGNLIRTQNALLFMSRFEGLFDADRTERFVPEYRRTDEDGEELAEWVTTVDSVETFLAAE